MNPVIDEVKARTDIVEIVGETVKLRRSGKSYTGFCPFHHNVNTPSFVIFPETGTWRCFGQCNEGGDVFGFLMKKEGWDFGETLRFLAEKAGIELKPLTPQAADQVEAYDRLRQLLEDAVTFYRHNLLHTPAGQAALAYLHKRGLNDETIEAFGLGYAPQGWDLALTHFRGKGFSEAELLEAGLVTARDSGGVYDRFRHRVMFPIRDERGRMAGFGARILNPDDVPKFLNSPQTPVFDKGRLLYGLDRARKAIRATDQAVIVEGYLDVIALHQHGFSNAVSPMGTALTEAHLQMLKRFTRRIVLALDPDAAGDKATLRGLEVARQALDRESEPVFDARGLLSFEGRLQADIRVTTLPDALDPDDVVNRDPAEWERLLAEARPVVVHVMHALAHGRDLDDAKTKNEIAAKVLPLIEDVASTVEREAYRQQLARLLRIDERALLPATRPAPAARRGRGARPVEQPQKSRAVFVTPVEAIYHQEMFCLGLLLRRPDLVYQLDRQLQAGKMGRLAVQDFQRSEHQAILRLLLASLAQDDAEPLNFVLNSLDESLMGAAEDVLASTATVDIKDERILEELARTLLNLRRRELSQRIDFVRFQMEELHQTGDFKANPYAESMREYTRALLLIDQALRSSPDKPVPA